MDIQAIQPPNLNLPHIDEVKIWVLTINAMIWIENEDQHEAG